MLTDLQREAIPEAIQDIFEELNRYVVSDIARRIAKTSRMTETAELMVKAMQEQGYNPTDIQKAVMKELNADKAYQSSIAKNTREYKQGIQKEINRVRAKVAKQNGLTMAEVGNMSFNNNLALYAKLGKDLTKPNNLQQLINAATKVTGGTLKNLTNTKALVTQIGGVNVPIINAYQKQLDLALIKTASGVTTYQQATRDVVTEMAKSGVRAVIYESIVDGVKRIRTDHLDVASRRAVLTGSSQLAGAVSMQNAVDIGAEYVEVSSHAGARPSHAEFQGRIFALNGYKP